jgi:hypothetical protein
MNRSATDTSRAIVRSHWLSLVLLGVVIVLTRLPFLDHPRPVHGDEIEFIAAIGFPTPYPVHHPGYPLWVALATIINKFGLSPYASYQVMSVIGSGLLAMALCRLASRFVDYRLAWWTGFAIGVNPIVWFLGTTALNYVFATALTVLILDLALSSVQSQDELKFYKAALILIVGTLLRFDLVAWCGPFVFLAGWRKPRKYQILGYYCLLAVLNNFVRRQLYSDGSIGAPSQDHTLNVIISTSVFKLGLVDGLCRSTVKLAAYLGWSLGVGMLLLIALGWRRMPVDARPAKLLLWLWCAPMTAFILLIHASEAGHMLPLIPAIYLLLAIQLSSLCRPRHGARPPSAVVIMVALAACSMIQFLTYPWSSASTGPKRTLDAKVAYMSAAGLRHIDERRLIHDPGDFWPTATHHRTTIRPTD